MGRVPPGSHGNTWQQTADCVERENMNKFLTNFSAARDRDAFHRRSDCHYTRVPTSMPGDQPPAPGGGKGLLRGSRTRSYGSLVRSPRSPVRRIEHTIQPGETLQGLALRYGVSMEEIKRANRLYTNDSIFLKKSLSIPVLSDLDGRSNGLDLAEESAGGGSRAAARGGNSLEREQEEEKERAAEAAVAADLTPVDFLKRLDDLISQSKQAAAKGREGAEKRVAALEEACGGGSGTSDWRPLTRSQSVISSSRAQRQGAARAAPLALSRRTKNLRDGEDEIFEL